MRRKSPLFRGTRVCGHVRAAQSCEREERTPTPTPKVQRNAADADAVVANSAR